MMVDKNKINMQKVDKAFKLGKKGSLACLNLIEKSLHKTPNQAQHALAGAVSYTHLRAHETQANRVCCLRLA